MQTENLTYRNNGTGLEKIIGIDTTTPPPQDFPGPLTPPPPWKFQSLPWGGYGYFLEPHNGIVISLLKYNFMQSRKKGGYCSSW